MQGLTKCLAQKGVLKESRNLLVSQLTSNLGMGLDLVQQES
jgi:hypothetical protein